MFDLSMQSALDIFCYVLVLIYGLALSADLSTGGYVSRQQKYLLTLLCLLFLLMQGLGLVLLGERAVKQLYPLVTHVPLVLILILFMKKSVGVAIVSTCTAYLCCQPPPLGTHRRGGADAEHAGRRAGLFPADAGDVLSPAPLFRGRGL